MRMSVIVFATSFCLNRTAGTEIEEFGIRFQGTFGWRVLLVCKKVERDKNTLKNSLAGWDVVAGSWWQYNTSWRTRYERDVGVRKERAETGKN